MLSDREVAQLRAKLNKTSDTPGTDVYLLLATKEQNCHSVAMEKKKQLQRLVFNPEKGGYHHSSPEAKRPRRTPSPSS